MGIRVWLICSVVALALVLGMLLGLVMPKDEALPLRLSGLDITCRTIRAVEVTSYGPDNEDIGFLAIEYVGDRKEPGRLRVIRDENEGTVERIYADCEVRR